MSCKDNGIGLCPDTNVCDSPWDLTETSDNCIIDEYIKEALDIAGAKLNVFKLLGVHEQGTLIDLTGNGQPLSSGETAAYPATNAFLVNNKEWRSIQKGAGVTSTSFIGYDFGEIKIDNGRLRYGIETSITHLITSIAIQQSANANNRVTKARLERSDDGITWYGAAIVDLPDDADAHYISIKKTAKANKWRLRPIVFNGGTNDFWGVQQLQLIEYDKTSLDNIQDYVFLENRDRDYADEPIELQGHYDLVDTNSELTRFGIELPSQTLYITVSFTDCVEKLGRPIVVDDIIEIPSETQYSKTMEPIKKYMQVTEVSWSTEGYTPGWKPTLLRLIVQPALATQETQDVMGDFAPIIDSTGLFDVDTSKYADIQNISDTVLAEAEEDLPERGEDNVDIRDFSEEEKANAKANRNIDLNGIDPQQDGLFVEDGLPPNGQPYTQGDEFPANPTHGAYHRLTYSTSTDPIPARLFIFSASKNRWVFLESDKRMVNNPTRPALQAALSSNTRTPANKIGK